MSGGRTEHISRGVRLEWFTVAYNSLEALIALIAGLLAGSVALVGFGFDSVLEVTSGATLLWRLHADRRPEVRGRVEALALKIVGWCFLLLSAYVAYDAATRLVTREVADRSAAGMVLAAASLLVMPILARANSLYSEAPAASRIAFTTSPGVSTCGSTAGSPPEAGYTR